jgi:Cysteine-rich CPXCG
MAEVGYQCAGCGKWNETFVDESAGGRQQYVEDCQVCCKPNLLDIRRSEADDGFVIHAELES